MNTPVPEVKLSSDFFAKIIIQSEDFSEAHTAQHVPHTMFINMRGNTTRHIPLIKGLGFHSCLVLNAINVIIVVSLPTCSGSKAAKKKRSKKIIFVEPSLGTPTKEQRFYALTQLQLVISPPAGVTCYLLPGILLFSFMILVENGYSAKVEP